MRVSSNAPPAWMSLFVFACAAVAVVGCSRTKYRLQADHQAYDVIAERNVDPRWCVADYSIEIDPRSRYFDPYDPDHSPMPPDDPTSHQYMHCVAGMKGWKHWHDNGDRIELENPAWYDALAEYVEIAEDGSVKLNVDSSLRLAYVHSPSHQSQLETLYLSALDVSRERFRLDTQFFAGHGDSFWRSGRLWREGEQTSLTVDTDARLSRDLATAGELLVGFANQFVFEFAGTDTNFASSIVNFSLVQPLLRGAGRDIALEDLTNVERALLADLRAYSQYQQGFYTQVAIGELGIEGPQRGRGDTAIAGYSGEGGVGGYIGLLQQLQRKRNSEANLVLQERSLARLEAFEEIGVIDMVQVDQVRQSTEGERANLLLIQNGFELALDRYKTGTLGLPPDLPVELDDTLIRQFQLVAPEATAIEDSIVELQDRVGELADARGNLRADVDVETIRQILTDAFQVIEPARHQLGSVQPDLDRMEQAVPARERMMTDEERERFQLDRDRIHDELVALKQQLDTAELEVTALRDGLSEETKEITVDASVNLLRGLLRLVQGSMLIQARARLETVSVETIDLDSEEAFGIAFANRMDLMNGRAALVDSWRSIQIAADALQSVLDVTASGDVRTARDNPVSFRAPTATLRLGLELDAPFTRLLERNAYRESLVTYQRSRRSFIQSRDSIQLGIRGLLRQIEQFRKNLEIQRRAVTIAIRRVDMTRAAFYAPVRPPQPGQRPAQFGPTAATNLLTALAALRNTQNALMSVWLNYYAARMRLDRELGIMVLDQDGRWMDYPPPSSGHDDPMDGDDPALEELPPPPPTIPTM